MLIVKTKYTFNFILRLLFSYNCVQSKDVVVQGKLLGGNVCLASEFAEEIPRRLTSARCGFVG